MKAVAAVSSWYGDIRLIRRVLAEVSSWESRYTSDVYIGKLRLG